MSETISVLKIGLLLAVSTILSYFTVFRMFGKKWNPKGLHVYITGGSTGLGLSLAILLAKKGAHISIVARNQERLDKALKEIESARQNESQIFQAHSFSLNSFKESAAALTTSCEAHGGKTPDAVFACAGSSKPMFFVEMTDEDMSQGMVNGYWVQAWTAMAAAKQMVKQNQKGKIVLVSSVLGYISFVGWASYAPAKHALRGLADTLQSELLLYGIDVHCFFPGTMYTPGYDEENKTKPAIVKHIESTDEGLTADQAAQKLFAGIENGEVHITVDLITKLFRASTRGATNRSNWFLDGIYDFISYIATPIWKSQTDKSIIAHKQEHQKYLQTQGFFTST